MKPLIYSDGVLDTIGNTPLVRIKRLCPNPKVEIWAKLEAYNPGGSIKDRIAKSMIEEAERKGELTKDKVILEATSGNTGIGLALVGAVKGYRVLLAMSEGVSEERRKILRALGAEFLLTPKELGTDGAIEVVYRLRRKEPEKYFIPDQYNNEANPKAHYEGTAKEIIEQTGGRITHFVASMGTTGTLMGCAKRLKEFREDIKIIGVEPFLGHKIQGLKNLKEAYRPGIFQKNLLDEKVNCPDEEAFEFARMLAREEGLLVGMSSGAAMWGAWKKAQELEEGVIVVIFPDGGERYLSTELFQVKAVPKKKVELELYNTYTKARMKFEPKEEGKVGIYTCGPTVYAEPTLGLLRRIVVTDCLRRYLEFLGLEVRHVVNITDIDDNMIAEAQRQGVSLKALAEKFEKEFLNACDLLRVERAWKYPRASEHVNEMIAFTKTLVEKGFAYERLRSVYFDIGKCELYGAMSGVDLSKIRVGATVDLDDYEKDDPRDFTLLKRATLKEMAMNIFYETEWGNVRPGWHLECAVMSTHYLGDEFDIHTSGVDLLFPHSENELALCCARYGKNPARFWLHTELVYVGGKKMSRSLGNAVTLSDLMKKGFSPREVRFFLMATHYAKPLNFSEEKLLQARAQLRRLDSCVFRLQRTSGFDDPDFGAMCEQAMAGFTKAMDSDLNVPGAMGAMFAFIRRLNGSLASGRLSAGQAKKALEVLKTMDSVIPIVDFELKDFLPAEGEVEELLQQREDARARGDFALADKLRDEIRARGFVIEDTPFGPVVYKR